MIRDKATKFYLSFIKNSKVFSNTSLPRIYLSSLLLIGFWLAVQPLFGQSQTIGSWQSFLSTTSVRAKLYDSNTNSIWVSTTGGLLAYDASTLEITEQIDPISGLYKSLDPKAMVKSPELETLIIGYRDGMIDLFDLASSKITRIDDIFRSTRYNSKSINHLSINPADPNQLWISTDFGVVVYNISGRFVSNTITVFVENSPAIPIKKSSIVGNRIYVLRNDGLYSGNLADIDFLTLPQNWRKEILFAAGEGSSASHFDMVLSEQSLIVSTTNSLKLLNISTSELSSIPIASAHQLHLDQELGLLYALSSANAEENTAGVAANLLRYGAIQESVYKSVQLAVNTPLTALLAVPDAGLLVGTQNVGVAQVNTLDGQISTLPKKGPSSNFFDGLSFDQQNGVLLSGTTGQPQVDTEIARSRGVQIYDAIDDTWTSWSQLNVPAFRAADFRSVFRSETFKNSYFFGSWGKGILRYDYEQQNFSSYRIDEGVVGVSGGNYSVIHGFDTDPQGRLWAISHFSNRPLHYYDEENDRWVSLPIFSATSTADVYRELLIDRNGNKWMTLKSASGTGLVVASTGDPADFSDDESIRLTTDLLTGNLPSQTVNALIEDQNGEVWIGTASGIARFIFPEFIIQGGRAERTAQWLINADTSADRPFLLPEINVNTMEVDGANQKWVGTPSDGLWVLDELGGNIVSHFTAANSELLSDAIIDLAFDKSTGDMYIATDKGLMRYKTATLASSANKGAELSAFPNPFNYNREMGNQVTIEGLPEKSIVKILTVDGVLVDQFTATGGRTQWQIQRKDGGRLASGVYLVIAVNPDNGDSRVGKLVVIR